MAFFRIQKDKDNPYVMINKYPLNDAVLSWKAKGILAYLLSLPDDWQIYEVELQRHAKDGIESLRSGITELIEAGYIERWQERATGGKFDGYGYDVHEQPVEVKTVNGNPVNGKASNGESNTTNKETSNNNNTKKGMKDNANVTQKSLLGNKPSQPIKSVEVTAEFISDVVAYLNSKTGRKYNAGAANSKKFITARAKEGHSLDDFKKVIDVKCAQWLNDEKMDGYLRPETLFGTKFGSYLNEKMPSGKGNRGQSVESIDRGKLAEIQRNRSNQKDDEIF